MGVVGVEVEEGTGWFGELVEDDVPAPVEEEARWELSLRPLDVQVRCFERLSERRSVCNEWLQAREEQDDIPELYSRTALAGAHLNVDFKAELAGRGIGRTVSGRGPSSLPPTGRWTQSAQPQTARLARLVQQGSFAEVTEAGDEALQDGPR